MSCGRKGTVMEISDAVNAIAAQMGTTNIMTSLLKDDRGVFMGGCQLMLSSGAAQVTTLVHHSDIEGVLNDRMCDRFETRIRVALSRLQPRQRRRT